VASEEAKEPKVIRGRAVSDESRVLQLLTPWLLVAGCVARVIADLPRRLALPVLQHNPMFALRLSTNASVSSLKQIQLFTVQHVAFQKPPANRIVSRSPRANRRHVIMPPFVFSSPTNAWRGYSQVMHKLKNIGVTP
jgi:hypothetical protein